MKSGKTSCEIYRSYNLVRVGNNGKTPWEIWTSSGEYVGATRTRENARKFVSEQVQLPIYRGNFSITRQPFVSEPFLIHHVDENKVRIEGEIDLAFSLATAKAKVDLLVQKEDARQVLEQKLDEALGLLPKKHDERILEILREEIVYLYDSNHTTCYQAVVVRREVAKGTSTFGVVRIKHAPYGAAHKVGETVQVDHSDVVSRQVYDAWQKERRDRRKQRRKAFRKAIQKSASKVHRPR